MITGVVSSDGIPLIRLSVAGQTWTAIVDSGFNGYLELPQLLRNSVNAKYQSDIVSILAAGQEILEESYDVLFPFDGELVRADATFVDGSEILLGTAMLRNYRLDINFKARTVLIERAA